MDVLFGSNRRGFSLVEVVLALGITTFALVAVIGLMPTGLLVLQEAMRETTATQILRKIGGEIAATPYDQMGALAGQRYFDIEGTEVAKKAGGCFVAKISDPAAVAFPGSGALSNLGEHAVRVVVEVAGPDSAPLKAWGILVSRSDAVAAGAPD